MAGVDQRLDQRAALIRVFPQLGAGGAGGAVDIREYPAGGWLNT